MFISKAGDACVEPSARVDCELAALVKQENLLRSVICAAAIDEDRRSRLIRLADASVRTVNAVIDLWEHRSGADNEDRCCRMNAAAGAILKSGYDALYVADKTPCTAGVDVAPGQQRLSSLMGSLIRNLTTTAETVIAESNMAESMRSCAIDRMHKVQRRLRTWTHEDIGVSHGRDLAAPGQHMPAFEFA